MLRTLQNEWITLSSTSRSSFWVPEKAVSHNCCSHKFPSICNSSDSGLPLSWQSRGFHISLCLTLHRLSGLVLRSPLMFQATLFVLLQAPERSSSCVHPDYFQTGRYSTYRPKSLCSRVGLHCVSFFLPSITKLPSVGLHNYFYPSMRWLFRPKQLSSHHP